MNKLIIGNWKMSLSLADSISLATGLAKDYKTTDNQLVVCPSFFAIPAVAEILKQTPISLGAQDAFWIDRGPYTGEVSAVNAREIGCKYVIIGHSERRQYLSETDRLINLKIKASLTAGLTPIICVGEAWSKRAIGVSISFVSGQIKKALAGVNLNMDQELIIAYEPIWAIGTGQVIQSADAQKMHQAIKKLVSKLMGETAKVRIIYGGSVDENNAGALLTIPEIDGFLLGGSSLFYTKYLTIANIK